jgi:hypothetical protein
MGIFGPTPTPQQPQGFNPMNKMQEFFQFVQNFQGNPQQQVQNMLNSGQMTQDQFNQLQNMWQTFGQFFRR